MRRVYASRYNFKCEITEYLVDYEYYKDAKDFLEKVYITNFSYEGRQVAPWDGIEYNVVTRDLI